MRSKAVFSFLIMSILHFSLTGQEKFSANSQVNSRFLLLGTLSDYMGRFAYVDKADQVDRYYYYEESLIDFIDSMAKADMNVTVREVFNNGTYETYSWLLSEIVNTYYDENSLLIDSLFRTNEEICSFITGRYYRYGRQLNDSIFRIQVQNSPDHGILLTLLKRIGCTKVYYKYVKTVPSHYLYYFIPTDELNSFLSQIHTAKAKLEKEFKEAAIKILGDSNEYEKKINLKDEKDLNEIIVIFRNPDFQQITPD